MIDARCQMLERIDCFADLPRPTLQALMSIAVPLERPARTTLLLQGEPADALYLVVTGRVKLYRVSLSGREQVLNVVSAGGMFNLVPLFDGGPCPASAEVLSDVQLLVLPAMALLACLDQHPFLARALLNEVASRLRHFVDLVDTLALHTVQGRLAHLLLEQAEALARGEHAPPITHTQMAAQLGTVREMVGRTLKGFEALGLIRIERNVIHILDHPGLEQQAEL